MMASREGIKKFISAVCALAAVGCACAFEPVPSAKMPASKHVFSMSCKVTACNGELATPEGRAKAVAWWKRHHITKLWLESYRHRESVPSELLAKERDAFRAEGFEVCGMITPTSLNDLTPESRKRKFTVTCWSDPKARARMREECARAARLFDTVILDDFLFSPCGDGCARCRADKAARKIADWGEYKRTLLYEVCERDILPAAKAANPKAHFIIKYPCWWRDYEKRGYSPARQAALFGECWVGTETRNRNPHGTALQACWIMAWMDHITGGRCGGGWYDALDCGPKKFVEQARYTILGGAKESFVHCYDYLLAKDPGVMYESSAQAHDCCREFERESDNLVALAELVRGAERGPFELMPCGVSRHEFRKDGKSFTIYLNTKDAAVAVPGTDISLAPHELRTVFEPAVLRVGVINWDCSPPSDTWFGGYQTRSLSPARYRYLTPYYADAKGPDEISYHRRTPAEYDRELQYAIDAGIDYFAYCWYGEDPHATRVPLHSGRSISCEDHLWEITWARQFHMKSPLREKIGLCAIILGSHVYTDEEVAHLAEAMREPCYEKVAGGRPLLYIFGDVTKGEILARIRRAARTAGVAEPFVVAMHGTRKSLPATGDRSVQARTFYAPPAPSKGGAFLRYPDMYAAIRRINAAWIDQGFDIVPAFATGRDHWPRIEHQVPWTDNPPMRYASPATERELVECAKDFKAFMDANRAKCPLDHVLTYAWNEFEEGAYICPLWAPNGGADVSRLKAFAKVARIFKGEQGVTAVPDDPLPDLADLRKRLPEIFKGCEDSFRHEWFARRLEAAERLAALPSRTLLMQAELDEFRASFRDALAHWANDPLNPAVKPVELNARDFGVKGDGVADDSSAFARAVDAVRKLGGRPSVLRIPAGQYLLGTAKKTASSVTAHLDLTSLTNCVIVGDSPETTRFEFGVYGHTGVVFYNSVNTTLARADFSWREAPFSQTVLESYEPSNCTAIVRHHPGTLKPDDPRYARAKNAQVCGLFTADGKALHDRGAVPFFDRRADDLGGGRYRIYFDKKRPSMKKFSPRPGDVIVLPDRDNNIQGISTRGSSFCNLVHIWFRNARASTISGAGAHYVTADHCRTFPKSPDLVFSSNADTFYNARGSHLAHCEFWGMNDDGANSLGNGTGILSREGARTVVIYARKGGRVRAGDVLQILHPMEGRFAGAFRIAALRAFKAKNGGERWAITFDRDLPADLVTCAEAGQIDNATRYAISHGLGKVKKAPDLLFFPLEYGTGFTMIDNKIHDLRGCGLNVQCPHAVIDGNVFENISLGMKITGLTQWYEGTPPCNVVVRNNVFRDCNTGIAAHFTTINATLSKERPIRWMEIVSNRLENVARPFALNNVADEIVRDNEIISPKPKNAD